MLSQEKVHPPQFTTSVRGYDRAQVDEYVHRVLEWVEEYAARTREAEQELAEARTDAGQLRARLAEIERRSFTSTPESFKALGERVGRVLESALEAADELRAGVERDVRGFVTERERYAEALVAEAEARQQELIDSARDAVQAMLEAGVGQRRGVVGDIARLGDVRRSVIEEIGHLGALLTDAVEASQCPVAPEAIPELPSGEAIEASLAAGREGRHEEQTPPLRSAASGDEGDDEDRDGDDVAEVVTLVDVPRASLGSSG